MPSNSRTPTAFNTSELTSLLPVMPASPSMYSSPPLYIVSLSTVSAPCGQLQSKKMKWKIPGINKS